MKIFERIKNSKFARRVTAGLVTCSIAAVGCVSVFAADPDTSALDSALQSGFTTISDKLIGYMSMAVPIALGVIAIAIGIKYAISFFNGIVRKK